MLDVRFVIQLPAFSDLTSRTFVGFTRFVMENNFFWAIVTWMSPMPFPFAETVALTELRSTVIGKLGSSRLHSPSVGLPMPVDSSRRHGNHATNLQIAAEFDCNRHTVAMSRDRYLLKGLAGLQRAGSGRPRSSSPWRGSIYQFGEQHDRAARLSCHPLVAG